MTDPELFVLADRTLNDVVQRIGDDRWTLPIPEWIAMGSHVDRSTQTLRTLIAYHAYDDVWVPDMVAGRTMDEVGKDRWILGELLGDEPKAAFSRIVDAAIEAVEGLTTDDLGRTAHLSFGDFAVRDYLLQITSFRTFRAYEIAALIGIDPTLPDDLVRGVDAQLRPHVEDWRAVGVFGPAVEVADDASPQDKLLAMTGRTPR